MKTINISYQVYSFDELPKKSQDMAVSEFIDFLMDTTDYDDPLAPDGYKKAIDYANRLQTPWFTGAYIFDYCKDYVLDSCREYDYLLNGSVFNPSFEDGQVQEVQS